MLGIESLAHRQHSRRSKRGARMAAFFGILPGLGAVYNRQNVKALVHFLTVTCLFQLRHLGFFGGAFLLAGWAFYAYSIIDAYRTALMIAQGESAVANEDRFKQGLARRAPAIGLLLVAAGVIVVVQILQPFGMSLARLAPVALILLGGYLLASHFKRTRDGIYGADDFRSRKSAFSPPSLTTAGHSDRAQARIWRNR